MWAIRYRGLTPTAICYRHFVASLDRPWSLPNKKSGDQPEPIAACQTRFLPGEGSLSILATSAAATSPMTGRRAANLDRNLLANHLGHASRHGMSHFLGDTTWDLDGFGVMDCLAFRVRNPLHALRGDVTAGLVRHLLGERVRHHLANFIGASASLRLGHHLAYLVGAGASLVLTNHLANFVSASASLRLGHHLANSVGAGASLRLGHHLANFIGASFDLVLTNVVADLVSAGLDFVLANVAANLVRNFFVHNFSLVANAVDRLPLDLGDPNLLADFGRRALNFHDLAGARNIHASTAAGIPLPATRLADILLDDRTGAFGDFRLPVAAANFHFLRVVNGLADRVTLVAIASLVNRLADGVTDLPGLGFPNRLANGVTDLLGLGFPDRLADRIALGASFGFVNWLADRVADRLGLGFPDGLADRVALGASLGFPDRLADGVANLLGLGFPDRLANGVTARLVVRFVNWLADRVVTFLVLCLRHVLHTIDRLGVIHRVIDGLVAGVLLFFVDDFLTRLHHGIALSLGTAVTRRIGTAAVIACGAE